MSDRVQQVLDNNLIKAIVNGNDDRAIALINDGASPFAHDCMAVKEAINNDRIRMLELLLENEQLMHHVKNNPDIVTHAFIDEPQNSIECLKFIANKTDIDIESSFKNKDGILFKDAIALIEKFKLYEKLNEQPPRPPTKVKKKSQSMKI